MHINWKYGTPNSKYPPYPSNIHKHRNSTSTVARMLTGTNMPHWLQHTYIFSVVHDCTRAISSNFMPLSITKNTVLMLCPITNSSATDLPLGPCH